MTEKAKAQEITTTADTLMLLEDCIWDIERKLKAEETLLETICREYVDRKGGVNAARVKAEPERLENLLYMMFDYLTEARDSIAETKKLTRREPEGEQAGA